MSHSPLFLTLLAGCHLVFPHRPGDGADGGRVDRPLSTGDGPSPCDRCDFQPGQSSTCAGPLITSAPTAGGYTAKLAPGGACSELVLELQVSDPRAPVPSTNAWLLDVGESPTNNGFGGDTGPLYNDSELDIVWMAGQWNLTLWANDYHSLRVSPGKSVELDRVEGVVAASGESRVKIVIGNERVEVTSAGPGTAVSWSRDHVPSGDPEYPCSFFCIGQREKSTGAPNEGILHIAFMRTISPRANSASTGVTRATLTVR